MKQIQHVRFKLSELINAAQKALSIPHKPTVDEAFSYYWNWARNRKWELVAVANQMDPNQVVLNVEASPQLELRNEEFWNVIWQGEDTDGSPDLVAEQFPHGVDMTLPGRVVAALEANGWDEPACELFGRKGYDQIGFAEVVEACETGKSVEAIVEQLENAKRF